MPPKTSDFEIRRFKAYHIPHFNLPLLVFQSFGGCETQQKIVLVELGAQVAAEFDAFGEPTTDNTKL